MPFVQRYFVINKKMDSTKLNFGYTKQNTHNLCHENSI